MECYEMLYETQIKTKFGAAKLCSRSNWRSHATNSYSIATVRSLGA